MPVRIDKLTPEQEAAMPAFRDQWIDYGLSTAPADRARVEKGIRDCYRLAGLEQPKVIVWVPSPVVGALAAPIAALSIELIRRLRKEPRISRGAVHGAVHDAVGDAVHGAVDGAVAQLRGPIREAVQKVWRDRWYYCLGGRLWSGWNAWRAFFVELCDLELKPEIREKYDAWMAAQSAGWWWPFKDFAMVCETPRIIARDERGRLHREDGPAVRFQDGWGIYAWHGVRVPERVIMEPESFTAAELEAERNSEIHRAIAEKLGPARYLELLGVATVDRYDDPTTGLSYELLEPKKRVGELQPRYLRMKSPPLHDGTQPYYVEPVDPELKSAEAARKWQFQVSDHPSARYYRHGDVEVVYAPKETIRWPTAAECNRNPKLQFVQEA